MNARDEWLYAATSARGSSHVRTGLPNQDAYAVEVLGGGAIVAAVSDGHGGKRYVRSDRGSSFAVSIAVEATQRWWGRWGNRSFGNKDGRELLEDVIASWHRAVRADAAQHPFTDDERLRAGTDPSSDVAVSYGATLLLAVGTTERMLLAQLGDGDIIVATSTGAVLQPVPDDSRLHGGQTTSLCLSTALDDCRYAVLTAADDAEVVVLSSDGYGNSFATTNWRERVGLDLRQQVRTRGMPAISAELPEWAAESAEAGGDDVTIVLLGRGRRSDAQLGKQASGEQTSASRSVPGPSRRRATLAVLAAALAGVALGAGAVALLRSDGAESAVPVTSTIAETPSTESPETPDTPEAPSTPESPQTPGTVGQLPSVDTVVARGPNGDRIEFRADTRRPNATVAGPVDESTPPLVRDLELDGRRWRITDRGALEVKQDSANWKAVSLGGPDGASLVAAGKWIWVIDRTQSRLIVIDPTSLRRLDDHPIATVGGVNGAPATGGELDGER